jgi:hypothetical protein
VTLPFQSNTSQDYWVSRVPKAIFKSYTIIGIMKKTSGVIVIELPEGEFHLTSPDMALLPAGQPALVISSTGDEEGGAWLSPVCEAKKKDLVMNIHGHIYVTGWREVQRILTGTIHRAKVLEFNLPEKETGMLSPCTLNTETC